MNRVVGLLRRHVEEHLLGFAKFRRFFVELLLVVLHVANAIGAKVLQRHDDLIVGSFQLQSADIKLLCYVICKCRHTKNGMSSAIYHIVAFILDVGNHLAELLQTVDDHLLVVRLRRADALEIELVQTLAERSLGTRQICMVQRMCGNGTERISIERSLG